MYQASAAFGNLIQQDSRTFKSKIVVDGVEVKVSIKNIKLTGGSNSGASFIIGSCISQYIEVEMTKPEIFIENKELEWKIGAVLPTKAEEYIPMGIFTAEKPEADEGSIKFTAYDRMMRTERAYFSSLPSTTTTVAVLKEISTFLNIPVVTTGLASKTMKKPAGYTCREVLSYISQMYGGFAICNRSGQIEIRSYKDSSISVGPSRYWDSFTHNDFPYTCQKITCFTAKDDEGNDISISAGSGTREMVISNPFMTQAILNEVHVALKAISYMPGALKFMGDPRLDAWDMISVVGMDGTTYKVPLMNFKQDFDGGLTTAVEAIGESETEQNQGFKGPMTQEIDRYAVKLALVDHAVVNKLDVSTANITFAKITDLEVTNAIITKLKVEDLVAINAKINTANINLANIENLLAGNAGVGDLVNIKLTTQNAVIESALIKNAVIQSVTVNDLLAGTIYTNKFQIWSDTSGGMKLFGSTQQWMDKNKRVRMQAGIDAAGNFNYYILDAIGNTMFDALNGIRSDGIKSPIITDSMVSDDANINGNKVNVHSLVQNINGSSVQISSSKVIVDSTGQSISVSLGQMQEEINGISVSGGGYILQTYIEGGHTGNEETATINSRIYLNNKEVTKTFSPNHFVWTRLSEDDTGDEKWNAGQVTGYSITLSGKDVTMVADFECTFFVWEESTLLSFDGSEILDMNGSTIIGLM